MDHGGILMKHLIQKMAIASFLFSSLAIGQIQEPASPIKVLIEFKQVPTSAQLASIARELGTNLKLFDNYPSDYFRRLYSAQIDAQKYENTSLQIRRSPLIKTLEEVSAIEGQSIVVTDFQNKPTNDPFISYQWGNFLNGQQLRLDVDDITSEVLFPNAAFSTEIFPLVVDPASLQSVLVAVLDSGLDIEHEDIAANVYTNTVECDSTGNIPFRPQTDNDGNGLKGDCKGWNFTAAGEGDNRPYDDLGHGTHVAGIIAAIQNNSLGIAGAASNVKILPVKIMKKAENLQNSRELVSFTDRVAKGILYAVKMKARVINLSLGWPASLDKVHLREAFKVALSEGVLIVAASGNNASERAIFPCSYTGILCVGASTINGEIANFSNFGGHVDVQAPGEQILSLFPNKFEPSFFSVRGLEIKNGTSQSAPLIAAMAAMAMGYRPELTSFEIKGLLHGASEIDDKYKTLSKIPSLKKMFELTSLDHIIRPVFKDIQTVSVAPNGEFSLVIGIEHFGEVGQQALAAKVSFDERAIESTGQLHFNSQTGQYEILVQGRFLDWATESEQQASIELTLNENKMSFKNLFVFARELPPVSADVTLPEITPVLGQQLRSVTYPFRHKSSPAYYLELPLGPQGGKLLKTYVLEGNEFQVNQVSLTEADRLLGIYRMDLNYDGNEDYLIRAIGKKGESQVILYYYLDSELKPLFKDMDGPFVYSPDQAVWDPRNTVFIKYTTAGKSMVTMAFKSRGGVPKSDRLNDPFNPTPDQGHDDHLYYFVPNFEKKEFTIRLFDTFKWREQLRERAGAQWWEPISLLEVFSQNFTRFEASQGSFLWAVGAPPLERYYTLELTDSVAGEVSTFKNQKNTLVGSIKVPLVNLDNVDGNEGVDFESSNLFVGMISDSKGQLSMLEPTGKRQVERELVLDYQGKGDSILGAQAAFYKDSKLYAFFQTKGHLLVTVSGEDSAPVSYKTPLHRVSFLPGSIFNELYYPVVAQSEEGDFLPGFYIDSTQLYARHLYLILVGENGPSRPLKSSYLIPENCRPLNPISYLGKESFTFLCQSGATMTLRYLPFL